MKETVNNQVSQFRQARQVTQEELAAAVDVSRQTIIAIERGNYVPSVLLALKIAKYFKAPIEQIFSIK
jgi:putative transcriptional regulator